MIDAYDFWPYITFLMGLTAGYVFGCERVHDLRKRLHSALDLADDLTEELAEAQLDLAYVAGEDHPHPRLQRRRSTSPEVRGGFQAGEPS